MSGMEDFLQDAIKNANCSEEHKDKEGKVLKCKVSKGCDATIAGIEKTINKAEEITKQMKELDKQLVLNTIEYTTQLVYFIVECEEDEFLKFAALLPLIDLVPNAIIPGIFVMRTEAKRKRKLGIKNDVQEMVRDLAEEFFGKDLF